MTRKNRKSRNNVAKLMPEARSSPSTSRRGSIPSDSVPDEECPICLDTVNRPSVSPCCGGVFCQFCINKLVDNYKKECPLCRRALKRERDPDYIDFMVRWFVQKVYRWPETVQEYFFLMVSSILILSLTLTPGFYVLGFGLSGLFLIQDFKRLKFHCTPNDFLCIKSSLGALFLFFAFAQSSKYSPIVFLIARLLVPIFWKKFSSIIIAFLENRPSDDRIAIIERIWQNIENEYSAFITQYPTSSISLAVP